MVEEVTLEVSAIPTATATTSKTPTAPTCIDVIVLYRNDLYCSSATSCEQELLDTEYCALSVENVANDEETSEYFARHHENMTASPISKAWIWIKQHLCFGGVELDDD
ncbi:uncharacterized protein LOC114338121 isoform X2 [Diabrotica virgifera virgifera]|uniref:Uncharacterized protein LOC114338121 isoform X2 n=1 Tax=Diabrotica virgifera virgifera TaxID=50390 RepID=A0A6P7GNZ7_DIAVI|nr:uncharacterized protein LOC114338121 isoform X2 [Diabrotica virgifera virgifera]